MRKYIIKDIKDKLKSNFFIQNALKYGQIKVYTYECESWNNDLNNPDLPKLDGTFDVDGHSSCDISVSIDFNLKDLSHWKLYLSRIINWITSYDGWHYRPEFKRLEGWTFVVDSYKALNYYVAEEIVDNSSGFGKKESSLKKYDEISKTITERDIILYLSQTHYQISENFWVNKNDPTCYIINESILPFQKKDGWSFNKGIVEGLQMWFDNIYGKGKVAVRV